MQIFIQTLVTGIVTGCLYALIALGYSMVYGVLKLLNFAHGDLYMVGAFIGYFSIQWFGGADALVDPGPAAADLHAGRRGRRRRRRSASRSSASPTARCATRRGSRR